MKFTKPTANQKFAITADAEPPSISFATDGSGAHSWTWKLKWKATTKSGTASTPGNTWDGKDLCPDLGGDLEVVAKAGKEVATIRITIIGTNPDDAAVTKYLASKSGSDGFGAIINHESKYLQFKANGEPIVSFDGGFGMCQLTTPPPSYDQVWNWKRNIDGGLKLFAQKRATALAYLGQSGRSYTPDQLTRETVCRWNGGSYHVWDAKAGAWARPTTILCDSKTGNIGWDMTDSANQGKTEDALHKRDSGSYAAGPGASSKWKYSGVCYADSILD